MRNDFDCVVDANVGIKLFLDEPLADRADALFTHLSDQPPVHFYVPDLFFIECANILWKHVRRFAYPAAAAQQHIADLVTLRLRPVAMQSLAEDALTLASQHQCSAYDAAYVALAARCAVPLVTADEALLRVFAGTEFDIRHLGDWPAV
ncbi:MAG TPA: type II toxin-antitoxin system VapC family toxin [Anaerolineae bacterium]|nr:type II toxin-antitoxin system VapC family toxin [Anaerolineae bacterium]HQI84267.1 type II toxin-antitoxin system VapC family toxin [Anaerolineae bacterium]